MARKAANTPKSSKPAGKAVKKAAEASKKGQRVSREVTNSRNEIRQQTPQRQGQPK